MINSVKDIDLNPAPGQVFWNCKRDWREEFIYFIFVDRFHDGKQRTPIESFGVGFGTPDELQKSCGGTVKGITSQLDYIKGMGATAIWLSPVFENNPESYHGYAIQNFLDLDPRFGTIEDLKDLVKQAHERNIRIILDVVLNHSGNNWSYKNDSQPVYKDGRRNSFGNWHRVDRPLPVELRNDLFYRKKGMISNWDNYPETQQGDFFSLKKFLHDESEHGLALQEVLIKIFCYWIKITDCDGFRLDAVKHLGALPAARFSTSIKEYCKKVGKENFFIFGEMVGGDDMANDYLSAKRVGSKIYDGLDSLLDFPLHFVLSKVVKGSLPIKSLVDRYRGLNYFSLERKESGRFLVTFLDNHDQIESIYKSRFSVGLNEMQLNAGLALLFTLPGIPCLYYGTEQALAGQGQGDEYIRETMFGLTNSTICIQNPESDTYREIARFAAIRKSQKALLYGDLIFNKTSNNGNSFSLREGKNAVLAFTRKLFNEEIIIVYNSSSNFRRQFFVELGVITRVEVAVLYGRNKEVAIPVKQVGKLQYIVLDLEPFELVILK